MAFLKKAGGGFLNGVNGKIVGNKWDSKEWGEGEKAYKSLTLELEVLQDGADEPVSQFLNAGFLYDDQSISDDGFAVEDGDEDKPVVLDSSEAGRFLASLAEKGFPEDQLEESKGRNLQCINNWRLTFVKELNTERQMAAGKKALEKKKKGSSGAATTEEIMLAGRRQDKNDKKKFYNHDLLLVGAVLGEPEDEPKGGSKSKPKPAAKDAKPAKSGKAKEVDPDDAADAVLLDLLAGAKDSTIEKSKLSSLIVRKALTDGMDGKERDVLRKLMTSDAFLERENGWKFDGKSKKQEIKLDE